MNRRLSRRRLAFAALEHVAHDDFVDFIVGYLGTAHRFADDESAEPRPEQWRQPAQVPAHRGPAGGEDDRRGGVAHEDEISGFRLLLRTSSRSFATNSSIDITTCLFPASRPPTAP